MACAGTAVGLARWSQFVRAGTIAKTAVGILVSLLLVAPVVTSRSPTDALIVPGVRVGKWTLAMTVDDLVRMNGPATSAFVMAGHEPEADAIRDFKWYAWPSLGIAAITFDGHGTEALTAEAKMLSSYKTDRGIGFQSVREDVRNAYGTPTVITAPQRGQITLVYDQAGVAFRIGADRGTVHMIYVFRPGGARRFWQCAVTC